MRSKLTLVLALICAAGIYAKADTIPYGFSRTPEFRIGADVAPACVIGTNSFLKGRNPLDKRINSTLAGEVRADFSFNPETREGLLYKGLYQGIGLGGNTFFCSSMLGSPVSLYVYQGAPVFKLGKRLRLGYEWQFGAAMGWKHYDKETADYNSAIGTSVTALMGVRFKLHYSISDRFEMILAVNGRHYSNGNSAWPNAGLNSIGASVGVAYTLNPQPEVSIRDTELEKEADRHRWMYDILVFGACRKRIVNVGYPEEATLCPGKFGVLGLQFSPLYSLNRWVAVGPALDFHWDESAGLRPYWVQGSYGDNIKFERPPFGKQISAGLSAHAELTMPIFALNGGVGFNIINPKGEKRFYQSLALKAFVTDFLYLNVGYRLGAFKDPQNLMIGVGLRLR